MSAIVEVFMMNQSIHALPNVLSYLIASAERYTKQSIYDLKNCLFIR